MKHLLFVALVFASCQVVPDEEQTTIVADTVVSADTVPADTIAVDTISIDSLAE